MKPKLPISVYLLAATLLTTATALSLQNFQELSITSVPLKCLVAYDTSIPSCTIADFGTGHFCSSSCISALTTLQSEVTTACSGVTVPSSTLLGMIFNNQLVNAICSVASSSSTTAVATTSATSTSTSTPAVETTASTTSTSTSTTSKTTTATTAKQTTTTQQSTSTSTTITTIPSFTSLPSTISTLTSTTSSTSSASVSPTSSVSTSSTASSSTTTSSTSTSTSSKPKATSNNGGLTSEQKGQLLAMQHSGGGSPFDIFVSPGTRAGAARVVCVVAVVGWLVVWAS